MSPEVLRRRLHEKKKHKPFRKCLRCGRRMNVVLRDDVRHVGKAALRLFKVCREGGPGFGGCGHEEELFVNGRVVERQTHTPQT